MLRCKFCNRGDCTKPISFYAESDSMTVILTVCCQCKLGPLSTITSFDPTTIKMDANPCNVCIRRPFVCSLCRTDKCETLSWDNWKGVGNDVGIYCCECSRSMYFDDNLADHESEYEDTEALSTTPRIRKTRRKRSSTCDICSEMQ